MSEACFQIIFDKISGTVLEEEGKGSALHFQHSLKNQNTRSWKKVRLSRVKS